MSMTMQYKGDMLFEVRSGSNKVLIDVPSSMGGKDRGMNPTQLVGAALAACTGVMVVRACKEKGVDLTGMRVKLDYEYADDPVRIASFKGKIVLPDGMPEQCKQNVLEIARTCPVHETLKSGPAIDFELAN